MLGARTGAWAKSGGGWTNPYVTDGLVAMLDGEWNVGGGKHDSGAKSWIGLDGHSSAIIQDGVWGDNYLSVTTGVSNKLGAVPSFDEKTIGPYTWEVVGFFSGKNFKEFSANFLTKSNYFNIQYNATGKIFTVGYDAYSYDNIYRWKNPRHKDIQLGSIFSFSGTYNWIPKTTFVEDDSKTFFNGQAFTKAGNGYGSVLPDGIMSVLADTNGIEFRVYCIRYYNRALTDAQIAANYAIDKARFNLP